MIVDLIERFMKWTGVPVEHIHVCDAGVSELRPDEVYMTRYVLWKGKKRRLYVHVFHRSDWSQDLHDHPWPFVALLVWPGYYEETDGAKARPNRRAYLFGGPDDAVWRTRQWPGMLLFRRAEHQHRVELLKGEFAVTVRGERHVLPKLGPERRHVSIMLTGPYERHWGFQTAGGWRYWKEWLAEKGCS